MEFTQSFKYLGTSFITTLIWAARNSEVKVKQWRSYIEKNKQHGIKIWF